MKCIMTSIAPLFQPTECSGFEISGTDSFNRAAQHTISNYRQSWGNRPRFADSSLGRVAFQHRNVSPELERPLWFACSNRRIQGQREQRHDRQGVLGIQFQHASIFAERETNGGLSE